MSELADPLSPEESRAGLLSRAVSARLSLGWEIAAFGVFLVIGAGLRFWDLGSRALHHDESLHGTFAYQLFQGDGYVHNPLMHGPFQFFGTALTFFLTGGASDYTVRVFPALFGTILILLPLFFRHRLGTMGALFASGLFAFSPTLLYFSRFARNDIYIAVFTLGIVISLWRYVDERKPLFLYIGAGLLGLSFATKENTYLLAAILIVFLNVWLAADFARQTREKTGEPPRIDLFYLLLFLPYAWAIAALWPFARGLRDRLGLRELHPAADFLIILGTLTLPQFAAGLQVPLEAVFGVEIEPAAQGSFFGIPNGGAPIVLGLLAATAYIGLRWNWRVWAIAAAAFYIPYVLLYTTFLTELDGFGSGVWGSLDYWLDQQDVRRGDQPWFYYLMLLPVYEMLALVVAAPALFYYAVKGDVFRRFLVFWVVGTFLAYSLAGEKMPWLSVHTTLPVLVLAAYVLGDLFSRLPDSHRLERIAPQALPFAAAGLGLAAIAFAGFGPTGAGWITLRVMVALGALGSLAWVLRPYDNRRLAVGLTAALIGALSLFMIRGGIIASYENGDVPREMLVFTQTSPVVPDLMDRIEEAGRVSGLGKDLPIFVDTHRAYNQPWQWYLRDYNRVRYGSVGADFAPETDSVVLLAVENEASMQPYLDQYQTPIPYPLRWWFPEFDTYKTLPTDNIPDFAGEFVVSLFRASTWDNWWTYYRDRETGFDLGFEPAVAFFPQAYTLSEPPTAGPTAPTEPLAPPAVDAQGRLVLGVGGLGDQPGAFSDASGLIVDSRGNIYVADTGNDRIQKFDKNGAFIAQVGGSGSGPGQFNQPADIVLDSEGSLYVVDTWNHRIQKFDADLNFVMAFGRPAEDLDNPEPDQMWGPRSIDLDAQGDLYVSDTGTHRIKKFSPDGLVLVVFGERGAGHGQFEEPVGLAVASNGDIWIADAGNRRLQRFDRDLNHVGSYVLDDWTDIDSNTRPYLSILPDDRILATDATHSRVLIIEGDGTVAGSASQVGAITLSFPRGVAVDSQGFVYVTEPNDGRVIRFVLADFQTR